MNQQEIQNKILALFREKELLKNIQEGEDFFDFGVSSLTVVELQIGVEKELKVEVATSELMRSPTVADWATVYAQKIVERSMAEF